MTDLQPAPDGRHYIDGKTGPLPVGCIEHDDGTIDAGPCRKCGEPTLSIVTLEHDGQVIASAFMCRPCRGQDDDELGWWRRQFEALLRRGWTREAANAEIIRRMEAVEAGRSA
jgi:hypothetical protein